MLIKGKYVDPDNSRLDFCCNDITIWDSFGGNRSFEEYKAENQDHLLDIAAEVNLTGFIQ